MKPTAILAPFCVVVAAVAFAAQADDVERQTLDEGKRLFLTGATPACAICHTLKDAGSSGTIGPDLDELGLELEQIQQAMIEGLGVMPSFADTLTDEQRSAIARYVVHATRSD